MSQSYTSALINKLVSDFQEGKKLPSFAKLKEFVNNNPSDETARYNFAVMCEQLNYKNTAKDHYNKILKKNSQHWRSKFNLYLIYIILTKKPNLSIHMLPANVFEAISAFFKEDTF